jgi:hypothetical protein
MVRASRAFQERTACESGLDVLDLVVVGALLGIKIVILVLNPFRFVVATVLPLVNIQAMALGLIVGVGKTTFPSLSETFFDDALKYFHFSGNLLNLSPEEVDLPDLLSKSILVRFSERAQFVQQCFM